MASVGLGSEENGYPLVVGHRGAMGSVLENSVASFRAAVDAGAEVIELDVRRTADGALIVIHDTVATDTRGRAYKVEHELLSDMRDALLPDPHRPGEAERIPLLDEVPDDPVIANAIGAGLLLAVEVKTHEATSDIVNWIVDRGLVESSVLYSFAQHDLAAAREIEPNLRTNLLFSNNPVGQLDIAESIGAWSLNPEPYDAHEEFVAQAHDRGFEVSAGRENDPAELKRLLQLDVWAVHSDFPERALEIRGQLAAGSR